MKRNTQTAPTIPGYRLMEYLLVLSPPAEVQAKVLKVKKEFYETYKIPHSWNSRPHLVLVHFLQYELMEERLISRLQTVAMGSPPIKVELKDYGSFPSHTLYINVTSKAPIQNLVKEIRQHAGRLMKLDTDNKPHFIREPHFTITGKLKPWQYEKGWLEYSNRHFTARFIADAMLLLKRPVAEKHYQIAGRFEFQNLPVTTRQGELFS
jgi:2'-5' RNA ligase